MYVARLSRKYPISLLPQPPATSVLHVFLYQTNNVFLQPSSSPVSHSLSIQITTISTGLILECFSVKIDLLMYWIWYQDYGCRINLFDKKGERGSRKSFVLHCMIITITWMFYEQKLLNFLSQCFAYSKLSNVYLAHCKLSMYTLLK